MKGQIFVPKGYAAGKYAVGTACFSVVDTGRTEQLGSGTGDRKIAVRMYYPADPAAVEGKERAAIFSEAKKAAVLKAFRLKTIPDALCSADYFENVPAAQGQTFPLIMFSMGYNSYAESNTYLLCALASRGYIIASVGHAYEAIENDYEDGSTDLFDRTIQKKMYTSLIGALLAQRKLVRSKASDQELLAQFERFQSKYAPYLKGRVPEWERDILTALNAVKERFAGTLDLSRGIGASGHSLGGCLAYYLCRYHEAFCCGINIDGALFGDYPDSVMKKPFCQISCRDNIHYETRPFFQTDADTYHVIFEDMKHIGFTDAKFFYPFRALTGKLDSEVMLENLIRCHVLFFDRYLKGEDVSFGSLASEQVKFRKIP